MDKLERMSSSRHALSNSTDAIIISLYYVPKQMYDNDNKNSMQRYSMRRTLVKDDSLPLIQKGDKLTACLLLDTGIRELIVMFSDPREIRV